MQNINQAPTSPLFPPLFQQQPPVVVPTSSPKEIKLNLSKTFTGKRTKLKRFLQDLIVYLSINSEIYENNEKRIAFAISFMTEGNTLAWKEDFLARKIDAMQNGHLILGSWGDFVDLVNASFLPYDAPR
jgi:sulfur transfer complex TusBCD TusB component (DsrH family)